MVTGRPAMARKMPIEVLALEGQQLGQVLLALLGGLGHDHVLHVRQPFLLHEHVLGAAEADALGAELPGLAGILGRVGVGAHPQTADLVGPAEHGVDVLVDGRGRKFGLAEDHPAGRAVHGDPVAVVDHRCRRRMKRLASVSILRSWAPAMQGLPMPRATTAACEVMPPWLVMTPWAWMSPWMSSGLVSQRTRMTCSPLRPALFGLVGVEDRLADCRPRGRAQTGGQDLILRLGIEPRDAAAGRAGSGSIRISASSLVMRPSATISTAISQGRRRGALAAAGLQHVELPVLDGELHVLHVAVVLLEGLADVVQLLERLGHDLAQLLQRAGMRTPATTSSPWAFMRNSP